MSADGSMSKALPQERPTILVVDEPLVPVAEETNNVTEPLLRPGPSFGIDGYAVSENGSDGKPGREVSSSDISFNTRICL